MDHPPHHFPNGPPLSLNQGFGKSNRYLEYVIFLNFCDVKKRHKSENPYIRQQNRVLVRLYPGYT